MKGLVAFPTLTQTAVVSVYKQQRFSYCYLNDCGLQALIMQMSALTLNPIYGIKHPDQAINNLIAGSGCQ